MSKVIIVSGGSDGLGLKIAQELATENQVVILAHNPEKLQKVAAEIHSDYIPADVTQYSQVASAVNQVIERHGRIDCLVNCAGIWAQGQITQNSEEEINNLLDVNTKGTIFLCKAVIPHMEKQGGGEIINIISQDGLYAKKDRSLYHSSKWAITGFTKCLQQDLAQKNIKVTGVYPGLMKTSLFEKKGVTRDLSHALDLEDVAKLIKFVIHLKADTHIPEIGIKHLSNTDSNMDDPNGGMSLNLDPDLITTQGTPQVITQVSPSNPVQPAADVVDITPDGNPPVAEAPSSQQESIAPQDLAPLPDENIPSQTQVILPQLPQDPTVSIPTPPIPPAPSSSGFDEYKPFPLPPLAPTQPTPSLSPPISAILSDESSPATESHGGVQPGSNFAIDSSSPLFENPDDVKPAK